MKDRGRHSHRSNRKCKGPEENEPGEVEERKTRVANDDKWGSMTRNRGLERWAGSGQPGLFEVAVEV